MKRLGVVLALLVLGSLFVGMGTVSATTWKNTGTYIKFGDTTVLMPVLVYDYAQGAYMFAYWAQDAQQFTMKLVFTNGSEVTISDADFSVTTKATSDGYELYILKLSGNYSNIKAVRWVSFAGQTFTYEFNVLYGGLLAEILNDDNVYTFSISPHNGTGGYMVSAYTDWGTTKAPSITLDGVLIDASDYNFNLVHFVKDAPAPMVTYKRSYGLSTGIIIVFGETPFVNVQFSLKDALTGQPLTGVTVKENGQVLGTLDDGGSLELAKGTHTLTFEKSGYWSASVTVDVQGDMTVSVEMYPSSAAFKLENFPADISIPENTIYELTFTLSPIDTSATYNTYLSLSGLSDIIEVRKDGSLISPEGGKYYLGDISSPVQVSIKFKAGAVGQHGFTISIESHDAIMSKTYTTTKTVTYSVEPLPFSVQMPSEWQVGTNELRISESSGQSYLITAVLKDSQGNEVWSDSYAFSPYEAHTFSINVPSEGSYTLELMWNGQTAVYDITVNPAISLKTKTLTVQEGGEGVITLHFKNPSSDVQYYTIKVSGGFLPAEINQSISVAPLAEKDVSIAFAVPEDLTYDAYELNVQILQGDSVVFQDKVAVSISDDGGFSLFSGGSGGNTWLYVGLGILLLGGVIWALRRR